MSDTPRTDAEVMAWNNGERLAVQVTAYFAGCLERELIAARDEVEKWRTAASVLCAAHVGIPQSSCPVCEVEKLKAERYTEDEALEYAQYYKQMAITAQNADLPAAFVAARRKEQ